MHAAADNVSIIGLCRLIHKQPPTVSITSSISRAQWGSFALAPQTNFARRPFRPRARSLSHSCTNALTYYIATLTNIFIRPRQRYPVHYNTKRNVCTRPHRRFAMFACERGLIVVVVLLLCYRCWIFA